MAGYRGHILFASTLGAGYGALAFWKLDYDWGRSLLGFGLTTVGGLLPDLDSDSGVPVRELFGLTAVVVPLLLHEVLLQHGLTAEQFIVCMSGLYLFIRFGLSSFFKYFTVHRGMFHSIPALLIAGLATYHVFPLRSYMVRLYLSGGVMLGFLSHLVLDELYSVDFNGIRLKFNKYAGSALKLFSPSWIANVICYGILAALVYWTYHGWPF